MTEQKNESMKSREINIGFLSAHNPHDRRAFSGTAFYAARALAKTPGIKLKLLGPHRRPNVLTIIAERSRLFPSLAHNRELIDLRDVDFEGLDVVVGLVATKMLDQLSTFGQIPYMHITDATPNFLREMYGIVLPRESDERERRVVSAASVTIYSSAYMARRASSDLNLKGMRALSVPFGINFDVLPMSAPKKAPLSRLELLFIGVDWRRKGGDTAVEVLSLLRANGWDARLTVVGRAPEQVSRNEYVTDCGFLDKNKSWELEYLSKLYSRAHFFLLPTRGDCSPMVLAEAMAHATPIIASDTGAVSELIGDDGAGICLPQCAGAGDWAGAIQTLAENPAAYAKAQETAFFRAHRQLTWSRWAGEVARIARDVVDKAI